MLYPYHCRTCSNRVVITRTITAEERKPVCIKCATEMQREYHLTGIILKGNGWASKE